MGIARDDCVVEEDLDEGLWGIVKRVVGGRLRLIDLKAHRAVEVDGGDVPPPSSSLLLVAVVIQHSQYVDQVDVVHGHVKVL